MPELKPLILDASTAAKWFINEPDAEKADPLLKEIVAQRWQIMAPELLRCELAQIFWKHRKEGYTWNQAKLAYLELEKMGLVEIPLVPLFPKTIETAYALDISIDDAVYVTLALRSRGTLATFDQELITKVQRHSTVPLYAF